MTDQYFATLPADECASEVMKRVDNFYEFMRTAGIFDRLRRCYRAYYGMSNNASGSNSWTLSAAGEQGELTLTRVNHLRNLGQHLLTLTTSQRPAMQPVATNTDHKSIAQTTLASGLLDYYYREKRVERVLKAATETAIVLGEGYVKVEWDVGAGEEFGAEEPPEVGPDGVPLAPVVRRTGDVKFSNLSPLDVCKDPYADSNADISHVIVRSFANKHDLAARYQEKAEKILALDTKSDGSDRLVVGPVAVETDLIPVFEFLHGKTAAVPEGRQMILLADDLVLFDGPLPYRSLPVYRIAPGDILGSPYGYTSLFDILGIQEAYDALYSAVITNQTTLAVQNVITPEGSNITASNLPGALNVLTYNSKAGKPEPLTLLQTPAEVFSFLLQMSKDMETLSNVNSVVRGNPEQALKDGSGAALALIQAQAIQAANGLQSSYTQLLEDVGTAIINLLRDFASVPRVAMIAGRSNKSLMREFTGDDLNQVNRVIVESVNPLSKTAAGRLQLAELYVKQGWIKTPEQLEMVQATGKLEPLTEGVHAELMLIRAENEKLAQGEPVTVIATDAHLTHIKEHRVVGASIEARGNPEVMKALLDHMQEHIAALKVVDPALLGALGEQSLAAPPPMPADPSMTQPPQPGAMSATAGPTPSAEAQMPSLPNNAATGERWNPADGGNAVPAV